MAGPTWVLAQKLASEPGRRQREVLAAVAWDTEMSLWSMRPWADTTPTQTEQSSDG